ncbi:MAG TPA: protein kinase [Gemmatimonadales bacterium]|nr:protein kinase [Gemmatimonadales bacterium]
MTGIPDRLTAALGDRYRLEHELGKGGMAIVYLAHDLKHDRDVALKVLRPELGAVIGSERFLAEIRITAQLDHPHILTLIDSGTSDGLLYYVLPFVRGESLRDKLDRERQLGLDDALTIARQVASALDFAHRQGVVHRDVKPENILLQEGEAMLADFGIALAVKEASGHRLTETGLSLGTPQYMSPEQATGDRVLDARSDVYSLGAVVYEMLAGEPPVTGPSAQAMIAKLLTERPTSLRVVRDTIPAGIEAAVARALTKTPADRFASAAEFAAALETGRTTGQRGSRSVKPGWVAVGAAVLALVALGVWLVSRGGPAGLVIGRTDQLTTEAGLEIQPAISPDGRLVAYSAGTSVRMRVFIRPVGGGRTIPLSDDSMAVETQARWSPDGNSLLFLTHGGVSVAPALGGRSRPVVAPPPVGLGVASADWSPSGEAIAFVRGDSLQLVSRDGGASRLLATAENLHSCSWSPDNRWIACVSLNAESVRPGSGFGNLAPSAILLVPVGGGEPVRLLEARAFNQSPAWSPDGRQLYFLSNRDGPRDVYALTLAASGRPRGDVVRLTTGLGASSITLTADGRRLAYAGYVARANLWSLPIPARPPVSADAATPVTSGSQVIESVRVSQDGRWLLYDSDLRGNADVYRIAVAGGDPEQLTTDPTDEFAPDLSPDGRAVAYHSWRTGTRDIEIKPLDGGAVERVTDTPAQESYPTWSPDGRELAFYDQVAPFTVYRVARGGRGSPPSQPSVVASPGVGAAWSPDGAWIAYIQSAFDGRAGPVMVAPAAGGPPRRLFEPGPAAPMALHAEWSPDGQTIYFKAHDADGRASFWAVSAGGGTPRLLVRFTDPDRQSSRRDFAVDGQRFYFAIEDRQSDVFVAEMVPR